VRKQDNGTRSTSRRSLFHKLYRTMGKGRPTVKCVSTFSTQQVFFGEGGSVNEHEGMVPNGTAIIPRTEVGDVTRVSLERERGYISKARRVAV
jgi:hypothetical protein